MTPSNDQPKLADLKRFTSKSGKTDRDQAGGERVEFIGDIRSFLVPDVSEPFRVDFDSCSCRTTGFENHRLKFDTDTESGPVGRESDSTSQPVGRRGSASCALQDDADACSSDMKALGRVETESRSH